MPKIKLSGLQKEILQFFGQNEFAQNFYWTGGTLLSFNVKAYFQKLFNKKMKIQLL